MSLARRSSSGFSLIEVLAALFIVSMAVTAALALFSGSLGGVGKATRHSTALVHARSLMEEALAVTDPGELDERVELPGGMAGRREVRVSGDGGQVVLYEISVTVEWPPSGSLTLVAYRTWSKDE